MSKKGAEIRRGQTSTRKETSMSDSNATGTVRLHRVLRAKPAKVYRAFTEAEAMSRWLPPNGFTCTVDHLDARVGGTFRMAFRNFSTGNGHSFGGSYLELVPGERLRYTDQFDDPNLAGERVTTVALRRLVDADDTSSLSTHLLRQADAGQIALDMRQRSTGRRLTKKIPALDMGGRLARALGRSPPLSTMRPAICSCLLAATFLVLPLAGDAPL